MNKLVSVLAGGIMLLTAPAQAQDYPNRRITWVIPNAPGSAPDVLTRIIAAKLSERLKQVIVVESRIGGNFQIAAEAVARAPADGYTLLFGTNTSHSANPVLFKNLRYDPVKDFTPIVRLGRAPFVLLVNPSLPVKSTAELIAYAKANPGKLSYAYAVSTSQISAATLKVKAGIDMIGVPYSSTPQAVTDLISGQIQVFFGDFVSAKSLIESGRLRALAIASMTRSKLAPDLPPVADTIPGFDFFPWAGLFGPANMPKPIVDRLAKEIGEILSDKDTQAQLNKVGFESFQTTEPAEFATFISDQLKYWAAKVAEAKIQKIEN